MQAAARERSRILIVEDDPGQAETLSDVLAADEREIWSRRTPRRAFRWLAAESN